MKHPSVTQELQILGYEVDNTWTAVKGLHCVTATSLKQVCYQVKKDLVEKLKK